MLRFRIADPKVRATAVTLARVAACLLLTWASALHAQTPRPRARDLGVPFVGAPGPLNAITDVAGVTVGHATLISVTVR